MALTDGDMPCAVCGTWMTEPGTPFYWLLPSPPERPERLPICANCWNGKRGTPAWSPRTFTAAKAVPHA